MAGNFSNTLLKSIMRSNMGRQYASAEVLPRLTGSSRMLKRSETSTSISSTSTCTCEIPDENSIYCNNGSSIVTVHYANGSPNYCDTLTTITYDNGQVITIQSTGGNATITYPDGSTKNVNVGEYYCGPNNPYVNENTVYPITVSCSSIKEYINYYI